MFLGRTPDGSDYHLKPKHLRTHGIVVGMTGSGKTGMALVALEELVAEGVPIIAIDPKGDLGNLGLLFPKLDASSFSRWGDGKSGEQLSKRWEEGLGRWGLSASNVASLADKLDFTMYTPGSEAGVPVDVLASLQLPNDRTLQDDEGRRALVRDTISGLLGLIGKRADPVRDPAHVVLSTILENAWVAGRSLDLEQLILELVDPPFEKVGVFPIDKFFSPDKRMAVAMKLNGVIASPSFSAWTKGAKLDLDQLLEQGPKTRVSVFSIAHLSDDQRQFFLALLLGRLLAWSRTQPGTEKLRAVLFFDEVAGWLPPHPKDPPSKRPLLLLMKQARAMGLGVVLATQNPVDMDYKAVSNAGLWCIGRLRTKQDRERLLQGIPGTGLDDVVQGLEKRSFLIARATGETDVVQSRHAMCFLRGPFTRAEITQFCDERGIDRTPVVAEAPSARPQAITAAPKTRAKLPPLQFSQHLLDPRVAFAARMDGAFSDHSEPRRDDGSILFRPALYAHLSLRFDEDRVGFVVDEEHHRVWFPLGGRMPEEHINVRLEHTDLLTEPPEGAVLEDLPTWMDEDKELRALQKRVVDDVYRNETEGMYANKPLKLYGKAGESEEDFRARCEAAIEELIDEAVSKLKDRYEKKADALDDKIRTAENRVMELRSDTRALQAEAVLGIGETLLSWFSGRSRSIASAASRGRRATTASARANAAEDKLQNLMEDVAELEQELEEEVAEIREKQMEKLDDIEHKEVRLEKTDIRVEQFGILWIPVTRRA